MERYLRQCVDDVKAEIAKKRSEMNKGTYPGQPKKRIQSGLYRGANDEEKHLTMQERDKIIEVLLS